MSQSRKRLTAKQETLARQMAKGGSIADAARALGVTRQSAHRMLTKTDALVRSETLRDRNDRTAAAKARLILDRSTDTVLSALPKDDSGDPSFALAAMRVSADVIEKIPDNHEAALATESPQGALRRYRSHIHAAIVGARNPALLQRLLNALAQTYQD